MADTNLFVASKPTTASAPITLGATSMTVAAIKDRLGNTLTMTDFGTKGYGVISPGKEKEEQFTFTGISSTTVSGISWVMMKSPYTETSGFAKSHAAGEKIVLYTNSPALLNTFVNKGNDETITGVHTFSASPVVPTGGTGTQAANATDIANAITGASGTATDAAYGTVKLSVAAASAPAPIAVGDNDPRVPTTGQTTLLAAITASAAELNTLDGYTGTTADLNEMSAIVQATNVTGAELETLTGGAASDADTLHIHKNSPTLIGYSVTTAANNTKTITIPANTLKTNGMIKATFSFVYSAHDLAVTFGGTSVGTFNASGVYEVVVIQTSTGNQTSSAYKQGQTNTPTQTALTKDMTASQNFVFQVSTSGTLYSLTVEVAHSI